MVWTPESLEEVITGRVKVVRYGNQEVPYRLTRAERVAYEGAKERHYLIFRGKRLNLYNAYYQFCALEPGVPFVVVKPRQRYADVHCDLIAMPRPRNKPHPDAVPELEALLRGASAKGAWLSVGTWTSSSKVPLADAESVAARLWSILTAPRRPLAESVDGTW